MRLHTRFKAGWEQWPLRAAWRSCLAALLLMGVAMLAGCSSIDEFFEPEPDATTAGGAAKPGADGVPGKDQPTPNLATVPDQAPKSQTTPEERKKIADQLIADNRQAQYADKVSRPDLPEVPPPARTPNTPNKGKTDQKATDQKADTPAKPEPTVSTTAPAPSAPTASVQMSSAPTQGTPAVAAAAPPAAAATVAPPPSSPVAPSPGSPPASATPPAPPPGPAASNSDAGSPSAAGAAAAPIPAPPPVMTPEPGPAGASTAGVPVPGARPSPPPLPPVLQEAQASPATQTPAPATAPAVPTLTPAVTPSAVAPAPQPETVTISGRSPRPLVEYVRKSSISALVASVYFPADSAQVKPEDVTVLRQLALEQAKRGGTFRVVSVARAQVADARAQEVAKILIDRGVNPGRVYAGTVPQTDPTFGQPRAETDPSNRRVDVYLDY